MLHDEPLDFIWLGVLLERVGQTARMLDVHHHAFTNLADAAHEVVETALWLSLLRALSGFEPYMKRTAGRVSGERVARVPDLEHAFPRSIAYCVHSAYDRLCDDPPARAARAARRRRRSSGCACSTRGSPRAATNRSTGASVHELLTHVVDEVHAICGTLGKELLGQR